MQWAINQQQNTIYTSVKILFPMHKLLKTNLKNTVVVCTWNNILHGNKDLFIAMETQHGKKLYLAIF